MFKGKIHLYKNIDGKECEIQKSFTDEKEFDAYISNNPELKKLQDFEWEGVRWPSLSRFRDLFDETRRIGDSSFLKEIEADFENMEKQMKTLFDRSVKLLKK